MQRQRRHEAPTDDKEYAPIAIGSDEIVKGHGEAVDAVPDLARTLEVDAEMGSLGVGHPSLGLDEMPGGVDRQPESRSERAEVVGSGDVDDGGVQGGEDDIVTRLGLDVDVEGDMVVLGAKKEGEDVFEARKRAVRWVTQSEPVDAAEPAPVPDGALGTDGVTEGGIVADAKMSTRGAAHRARHTGRSGRHR
jgi:hypothetical protein